MFTISVCKSTKIAFASHRLFASISVRAFIQNMHINSNDINVLCKFMIRKITINIMSRRAVHESLMHS